MPGRPSVMAQAGCLGAVSPNSRLSVRRHGTREAAFAVASSVVPTRPNGYGRCTARQKRLHFRCDRSAPHRDLLHGLTRASCDARETPARESSSAHQSTLTCPRSVEPRRIIVPPADIRRRLYATSTDLACYVIWTDDRSDAAGLRSNRARGDRKVSQQNRPARGVVSSARVASQGAPDLLRLDRFHRTDGRRPPSMDFRRRVLDATERVRATFGVVAGRRTFSGAGISSSAAGTGLGGLLVVPRYSQYGDRRRASARQYSMSVWQPGSPSTRPCLNPDPCIVGNHSPSAVAEPSTHTSSDAQDCARCCGKRFAPIVERHPPDARFPRSFAPRAAVSDGGRTRHRRIALFADTLNPSRLLTSGSCC
jgi:hypothetical protein